MEDQSLELKPKRLRTRDAVTVLLWATATWLGFKAREILQTRVEQDNAPVISQTSRIEKATPEPTSTLMPTSTPTLTATPPWGNEPIPWGSLVDGAGATQEAAIQATDAVVDPAVLAEALEDLPLRVRESSVKLDIDFGIGDTIGCSGVLIERKPLTSAKNTVSQNREYVYF